MKGVERWWLGNPRDNNDKNMEQLVYVMVR